MEVGMPLPDQSRVSSTLKSREGVLADVVLKAWERWTKNPEGPQLYRRNRSGLVHNYMMLDATVRLGEEPGIQVLEAHETAYFFVDDHLVVRFKKGDDRGLSSNIPTQAALAFNDPNESLKLFDLPDVTRVDVVYRLNDLETKIKDILVVARHDEKILWSYPIYEAGASSAAPTVQLPVAPIEPPAADSGLRVPGRGLGEEQRKDGTG
jgi:hypothetical protein